MVVLYASISVLNWMRAATGSQCKDTKRGVTWALLGSLPKMYQYNTRQYNEARYHFPMLCNGLVECSGIFLNGWKTLLYYFRLYNQTKSFASKRYFIEIYASLKSSNTMTFIHFSNGAFSELHVKTSLRKESLLLFHILNINQ